MTKGEKVGIAFILLGFLPVWRCGLRENLNFYEFVGEHTIFSPHEVEYIPEELLTWGETEGIYMEIR